MKLNPQHVTLAELFAGRLFRIPDYQRPYAWGTQQRTDLFGDIEEVANSAQDHFMATVVTLRRDRRRIGADDFAVVEIVDGQQRLTTLVMLFQAIALALDEKKASEAKVKRELSELLVKDDERSLVLLQTNHDSTTVMSDFLRKGLIPDRAGDTDAEKNLLDSARECSEFVARWSTTRGLVDLVAILRNRMSLVYHELGDEGTVYRVFEVLNSRGLDVKWIDKLKSQLLASLFTHINETARKEAIGEMHTAWQEIYRKLGLQLRIGDEALRFAATWWLNGQPNRILNQKKSFALLASKAGTKVKSIMNVVEWLSAVVDIIYKVDADPRLKAVFAVDHARFLATAILLRKFPKATEERLFKQWERLTFRIYGLASESSKKKAGDFVRLGYKVVANELNAKEISAGLVALGIGHDIDTVLDEIDWTLSYEYWQEPLRYLLYRYDEYLAREAGESINASVWNKIWAVDPSKSIEHIQPQSSKSRYIHHLGNLTMLPPNVNSSLKNLAPGKKAERYLNEGVRATRDVGRLIQRNGWNEVEAKKRTVKLNAFVRQEWSD